MCVVLCSPSIAPFRVLLELFRVVRLIIFVSISGFIAKVYEDRLRIAFPGLNNQLRWGGTSCRQFCLCRLSRPGGMLSAGQFAGLVLYLLAPPFPCQLAAPVFDFDGSSVAGYSVTNPAGLTSVPDMCGTAGAAVSLTSGAYMTYSGSTASLPLGGSSMSMIVWAKCAPQPSGITGARVFEYGQSGWYPSQSCFGVFTFQATLVFVGNDNNCDTSTVALCNGTWRHIAIAYDSSSSVVRLYVDAAFDVSCVISPPSIPPSPGVFVGWNGDVGFGSGEIWAGSLARARVYNVSLSPTEIAADFAMSCVSSSQSPTQRQSGSGTASGTRTALPSASRTTTQPPSSSVTPTVQPAAKWSVTTVAGSPSQSYGSADGIGTAATLHLPWGVAVDAAGATAFVVRREWSDGAGRWCVEPPQ